MAKTLALHCTVERSDSQTLWLILDKEYDTLYNELNHQRIASALKLYFSSDIVLHIRSGNNCSETPAMYYERKKQERLIQAREHIYADKNIRQLIQRFEASVDEDSIMPLENQVMNTEKE